MKKFNLFTSLEQWTNFIKGYDAMEHLLLTLIIFLFPKESEEYNYINNLFLDHPKCPYKYIGNYVRRKLKIRGLR